MRLYTICLVCFLTGLSAENARAQFKNYGTREGLPQSWVFAITKDKTGRMWMATGDGIVRFDGHSFDVVPCINRKGKAVKRFTGPFLHDDENRIWIGGLNGVFCFDPSKGRFTDQTSLFSSSDLPGTVRMVSIRDGEIWALDEKNTIYRYHPKRQITRTYNFTTFLHSDDGLHQATAGPGDVIYMCSKRYVFSWRTSSGIPVRLPVKLESGPHRIVPDGRGAWFVLGKYLRSLSADGRLSEPLWTHLFDGRFEIYDVLGMGDSLWIATATRGLYLTNRQGKLIHQYQHDDQSPESIPTNNIACIYSTENLYWFGTDGGGFSTMPVKAPLFKKIDANSHPILRISSFIKCVYEDRQGRTWAGTYGGGLFIFSKDFSAAQQVPQVPGKTVSLIHRDHMNRLWVGTDRGLYRIDEVTLKTEPVIPDPLFTVQEGNSIFNHMASSPAGKLYIASNIGLLWLNTEKGQPAFSCISDSGSIVFTLHINKAGQLFQAMYSDHMWVKQFTEPEHGPMKLLSRKPVLAPRVRCITPDDGNKLWLCSEQGLLLYNSTTGSTISYDEKNGMSSTFTYAALRDKYGFIWISTNKGVNRLDPKTGKFRIFSTLDNLQDHEFNTGAYHIGASGKMYLGGIRGINIFNPAAYRSASIARKVLLKELRIGNNALNTDSISNLKSLELNYDENNLQIAFAVPEFLIAGDITYFYRLNTHSTWTRLNHSNTLYLSNLAPGEYVIQVKAQNPDLAESEVNTILNLTIRPKWTDTAWFKFLVVLAGMLMIAGVFYMIYRHRLRLKMAELKKQEELLKMKQRIGRDLHDHLGASITRLNLLAHTLSMRNRDIDGQTITIGQIAREMKHQVDEIVWTVNNEYDHLDHFLAFVRANMTELTDGTDVNIRFDFEAGGINPSMNGIMRQNLMAVTKEAVNNALKYAFSAEIIIGFKWLTDERFHYFIKDNGVGFSPDVDKHFSNGLKNMRKRCEECGLDIRIVSSPGAGTSVEIQGHLAIPQT